MSKRAISSGSTPSPEAALRLLLDEFADTSDASSEALNLIFAAIDDYNSSKPYRDANGVRSRGSVSKTRHSLANLELTLAQAASAVKGLRLEAIGHFHKAYGAPRGGLAKLLEEARVAASDARKRAEGLPNKSPDYYRHVLAMDVARVFDKVLKRRPTATRDEVGRTRYARGGAAYARVLRATFAIAEIRSKEIGPDIDAGLRLFRELQGDL